MTRPDILEALIQRYDDERNYMMRPREWCEEVAGAQITEQQNEIITSVRDNRYTAVPSAHELGKTFIANMAICWWVDAHPVNEVFVVSTAPSAAQVSAVLWREVTRTHKNAKLRGRITRAGFPQWHIDGELRGYGRKPADYEESAFQGIHDRYVLVVIDEAGGVAKHLYDAIDSIVANANSRVLAIGNPDDPGSYFSHICKPGSIWNVIHLDGLRSPNLTRDAVIGPDPQNPRFPLTAAYMASEGIGFSEEHVSYMVRETLMGPLYVEESLVRWAGVSKTAHIDLAPDALTDEITRRAEQSALVQAKVRGIFPTSTSTGVIPLGWVQYAVNRWRDLPRTERDAASNAYISAADALAYSGYGADKVIGVDVAYTGQDETVIAIRHGDVITEINRFRHADTQETAEHAASHMQEPGTIAVVDVIGIGAGVYDSLRRWHNKRHPETGQRLAGRAMPFNASAASHKTDKIGEFKFRNDRAAAWWHMRELLDPSRGSRIALPDDDRLIEELVAVQYEHLIGVIKIESKEEIKKRLGRSTDTADAVIQSFWTRGRKVPDLDRAIDVFVDGEPAHSAARERSGILDYKNADGERYVPIGRGDLDAATLGSDWLQRGHHAPDVWDR